MIKEIFKIKKEERIPVAIIAIVFTILSALVIYHWSDVFLTVHKYPRSAIIKGYHFTGFDPLTLVVMEDWYPHYQVFRHPLLTLFMYPFYLLNQGLIYLTGINCGAFIIYTLLLVTTIYSYLFIYRIIRKIIGIDRLGTIILSYMLFSFAYVMSSQIAPDHFALSMTAILLTLYIAGKKIQEKKLMKKWEALLLLLLTAGITLNNGAKTIMASFFVNGKNFFKPANIIFAFIIPLFLLWQASEWQYKYFVHPVEQANKQAKKVKQQKQARKKLEEKLAFYGKLQNTTNPSIVESVKNQKDSISANQKKVLKRHGGRKKTKEERELQSWLKDLSKAGNVDLVTDRWETFHSNLFGESIQLHQEYLLGDALIKRPVFVNYSHTFNYVVEIIIVSLFLLGIWCGRHQRFLWLTLSFFALDMMLHFVLGFAINEIYIMSNHWIYVIPIAIGYIVKSISSKYRIYVYSMLSLLVLFLFTYNAALIIKFIT